MSTASKDPRINELFTEGSHHRNLSVLAINQNLYYNKDPTQRRNCHYLVLFNNPIDKQQVMTLARQMYPGNHEYLMRHFSEATDKPYGYLLIDLKPSTPESSRMRNDIFSERSIKGPTKHINDHFETDTPTVQTYTQQQQQQQQQQQILPDQENMSACDDCGIMFQDVHDLQRHVKKWCPENDSRKRKLPSNEENEPVVKKWLSLESLESQDEENESEEHVVFNAIMTKANSVNEEEWNKKYDKYVNEGMSDDEAKAKTEEKMKVKDMDQFIKDYGSIIMSILKLQNGKIHEKVMNDVTELIDDGYDDRKAIKMALKKNRHVLDEMWDGEDSDGDEDEEEEDSDDDEESEKDEN
ncbi:uncharacterized protein [Argopecten irradians]|uniref:uncharacterized protein n=1 Tax=Argopecten irradians TaxID=31199 RepID=UPI003719ED46